MFTESRTHPGDPARPNPCRSKRVHRTLSVGTEDRAADGDHGCDRAADRGSRPQPRPIPRVERGKAARAAARREDNIPDDQRRRLIAVADWLCPDRLEAAARSDSKSLHAVPESASVTEKHCLRGIDRLQFR